MSSDASRLQRSLPGWAVALIVFVLTSYVAIYMGGIALIFLAKQVTQNCLAPAEIAKVAKSIAKFPDPLPKGFAFAFGIQVGPLSIITIEHQPDKQTLTMAAEERVEMADAATLLNQAYDMGVNIPSTGFPVYAHFKTLKQKGQTEIAGEKMPYMLGELEDSNGKKAEGFIASIAAKSVKKNILIFGLQPPDGGAYNIEQTLCFLKSLTGF